MHAYDTADGSRGKIVTNDCSKMKQATNVVRLISFCVSKYESINGQREKRRSETKQQKKKTNLIKKWKRTVKRLHRKR